MGSDELRCLITYALYFRRFINDTCLQVNIAAQELSQHSAEALPLIEAAISNIVIPKLFPSGFDHSQTESDSLDTNNYFPGLSGVLGAYMLVCSKYDSEDSMFF